MTLLNSVVLLLAMGKGPSTAQILAAKQVLGNGTEGVLLSAYRNLDSKSHALCELTSFLVSWVVNASREPRLGGLVFTNPLSFPARLQETDLQDTCGKTFYPTSPYPSLQNLGVADYI